MILSFLIIAICFIIIFKSSGALVESSSLIASHYGLSPVFIGVVLVGLGTSSPELFVTMISSYLNHPGFVVGNAAGSIACNTGVALAVIFFLVRPGQKDSFSGPHGLDSKFCFINSLFLIGGAIGFIFLSGKTVEPPPLHCLFFRFCSAVCKSPSEIKVSASKNNK